MGTLRSNLQRKNLTVAHTCAAEMHRWKDRYIMTTARLQTVTACALCGLWKFCSNHTMHTQLKELLLTASESALAYTNVHCVQCSYANFVVRTMPQLP